MIPPLALVYLPLLMMVQADHWPSAPDPWIMAAQIERETCITLKHSRCWSPRAELKTSRENGIGFGQHTKAFNANGSVRFDKIAELRAQFPRELGRWTWENRYDPLLQLHGVVLMDRTEFARFAPLAATQRDAWAFALVAYNSGSAGLMKDRLLCSKSVGCNPAQWFGNVEINSTKSRVKWQGYGQSAFDISRAYPKHIFNRADVYRDAWEAS